MIKLLSSQDRFSTKDVDYILDKTDKFYNVTDFLTPKFEGNWSFYLIDPTIKFIKELLHNKDFPEWIDVYIRVNQKKLNEVALEFPEVIPKVQTKKEAFSEIVAGLKHLVDIKASKMLFEAYKQKPTETVEVIQKLDNEVESPSISVKDVQGSITFTKHTYASDVINAFLTGQANRWKLYKNLVGELGNDYAYYSCRKYVCRLLQQKDAYLKNKNVSLYIVTTIDAPTICFAYTLFMNSNSPKQLYAILYSMQNRSEETLNSITNTEDII